jgi:hypothetical protein
VTARGGGGLTEFAPAKALQDSDHLRASRLSTFRSKLATRGEPSASAANFANKHWMGCRAPVAIRIAPGSADYRGLVGLGRMEVRYASRSASKLNSLWGQTHRRQLHIVRNGLTSCRTSKSEDIDTDRANAALGFQSVNAEDWLGG